MHNSGGSWQAAAGNIPEAIISSCPKSLAANLLSAGSPRLASLSRSFANSWIQPRRSPSFTSLVWQTEGPRNICAGIAIAMLSPTNEGCANGWPCCDTASRSAGAHLGPSLELEAASPQQEHQLHLLSATHPAATLYAVPSPGHLQT